jgi:hypothetical protein
LSICNGHELLGEASFYLSFGGQVSDRTDECGRKGPSPRYESGLLTGSAETEDQINLAVKAAQGVDGVTSVKNGLTVRSPT